MTTAQDAPIYSRLAAEPDLPALIELFLADLPRRLANMQRCVVSGNADQLARLAHQLRGTAGSYGFDGLTPLAAALERAARDGDLAKVQNGLESLANACSLCRPGQPQ